jgi:hypothetical protein
MRNAQKDYERKPSVTSLYIKDELENRVDAELRARQQRLQQHAQNSAGFLFEESEGKNEK